MDLVGIGPSGNSRRDMPELQLARKLHIAFPERGHQTTSYLLPKDVAPPPCRYPTLAAGMLVDASAEAMGFPALPGLPAHALGGQCTRDYERQARASSSRL